MLIERTIFNLILNALEATPAIFIIYGPRQSGKTTLINQILEKTALPRVFLDGDDLRVQELLARADLDRLRKIVGENKLLVIDEAQRIENIGLTLKLVFDHFGIHIIASGSSSFDLTNKINEPLTGRTSTFTLYPFSFDEIPLAPPITSNIERLEEFLRFGMYPKVITLAAQKEKEDYLYELINAYLYRDILSFQSVRKPKKIVDLLSLLALQIGSEVSISELAQNLSLSKIIVEKYLDLLEKMFVLVNLRGFSRNLRKEISKTSKYYFVDLGLRNALIRNFNALNLRSDVGALFENFAIIERTKKYFNHRQYANFYFWRTYDQKEIDLIEEAKGEINAFEFKWDIKKTAWRPADEFTRTYENSRFHLVNPSHFEAFLET